MLDQASKIDLLEMPVFSEGSGGSRKFSRGNCRSALSVRVGQVTAAHHWCPYCTVSRERQMSQQSKLR
jgi:hypothetical protein